MMKKFILWTCAIVMVACTTTRKQSELTASGLKQSDFQTEVDGKRTDLFVLKTRITWRFVSQTSEAVSYRSWSLIRRERCVTLC